MADHRYDPREIEPRWQRVWNDEGTWEVSNDEDSEERERSYVLEMLPYPSGEPHIGHLKNYALGDAIAHFQRRIGQRVLREVEPLSSAHRRAAAQAIDIIGPSA